MPRYAAIDIGSNSMRLLVADVLDRGGIARLAEDRQVTRLGESVFRLGLLSEEAIQLAEEVLRRFRVTIEQWKVEGIRAVATSATRDAANQNEFLARAREALGSPVEIISGVEEARLVGMGVEAVWPQGPDPVLIIDVGGGSAEFILTRNGHMEDGYSRPLGAVRLKEAFLGRELPRSEEINGMQEFIDEKLELVVKRLGGRGYVRGVATSASAAAILCAIHQIPRTDRGRADRKVASLEQVRQLYRELCVMPLEKRRKLPGIGPRRAEIIIAGAAVFLRSMEKFELTQLHHSNGGVREGIVADLAARGSGEQRLGLSGEQRELVVAFAGKYRAPLEHAQATAHAALELFIALRPLHKLESQYTGLLEAACLLLDVGHFVSDTGHHKHSWYLVAHSDLPGFTAAEKKVIALLCRYHRKSMPGPRHEEFMSLAPAERRAVELLAPLLRLAEAIDRSRDQHVSLQSVELRGADRGEEAVLHLVAPEGRDLDLELWAIERAAVHFKAVYGMGVSALRN